MEILETLMFEENDEIRDRALLLLEDYLNYDASFFFEKEPEEEQK
jgi:hypothetical protein